MNIEQLIFSFAHGRMFGLLWSIKVQGFGFDAIPIEKIPIPVDFDFESSVLMFRVDSP